jgi:uncharacterized protein
MADEVYHPLYLRGIAEFNRRNFFESHEVWEELWLAESGPARQFYKGLIQAAVALYHLSHGNMHGANKLLAGSRAYLEPYRSSYLGLDVDRFLAAMDGCVAAGAEPSRQRSVPAQPPCTPQIQLHRPPE